MTGKREERGSEGEAGSGSLAAGGGGGVSSTDWVKALGLPLATLDVGGPSSGCKTERLRICSNIYWAHTWAWPGLGAELTGGEEDGNSG